MCSRQQPRRGNFIMSRGTGLWGVVALAQRGGSGACWAKETEEQESPPVSEVLSFHSEQSASAGVLPAVTTPSANTDPMSPMGQMLF